jgi:hypothetical protein
MTESQTPTTCDCCNEEHIVRERLLDLTDKSDAQLRAEKAAILRELSRRRKAARPKVRKVVSQSERDRARAYVAFRELHPRCWRCGLSENERPKKWRGVFIIERAHITKDGLGRRVEDVRLINALCTICHLEHTGGYISTEEMLAYKREHDPDNYDPEFLQLHSIRKLEFPNA